MKLCEADAVFLNHFKKNCLVPCVNIIVFISNVSCHTASYCLTLMGVSLHFEQMVSNANWRQNISKFSFFSKQKKVLFPSSPKWFLLQKDVRWRIGAKKSAKMRAQRAQEVAIGAQFPYRTFVVRHMTERGCQPNQQWWPKQRQPNQQRWPNVV